MQDITRGRDMVDSLFQGFGAGVGGTHNAVLSSTEYLSTAMRTLGNIEDGFYIAPGKAALAWGVLPSRPKAGQPDQRRATARLQAGVPMHALRLTLSLPLLAPAHPAAFLDKLSM